MESITVAPKKPITPLCSLTWSRWRRLDRPTDGPDPHRRHARPRHGGACLRWRVPSTPAERQARHQAARVEAMARTPPTSPQLVYVKALSSTGPCPAPMLDASRCIALLTRKGQP